MKAIVLFSGGMDSTVLLGILRSEGKECIALSFDYNQRHKVELKAAEKIAAFYGIQHQIIKIDPDSFAQSALVIKEMEVPKNRTDKERERGIPSTYVPGRNTLFIAYANILSEIHQADEIYVGFNSQDLAYPDCRIEYLQAYQAVLNLASRKAIEGSSPKIKAPFINWNKSEIVAKGLELNVPLELSFSCYDPLPSENPCNSCDACLLRNKAILH